MDNWTPERTAPYVIGNIEVICLECNTAFALRVDTSEQVASGPCYCVKCGTEHELEIAVRLTDEHR